MCLSWPKILNSVQPDWLWSTGRGGVKNKCSNSACMGDSTCNKSFTFVI